MGGVGRVVVDTGDEDARLVIEQRQGVGRDGDHGQAMKIAAQLSDEITVGDYGTDAAVVFIDYRRTDDDGLLDVVREIKNRGDAIDDGVDVGS